MKRLQSQALVCSKSRESGFPSLSLLKVYSYYIVSEQKENTVLQGKIKIGELAKLTDCQVETIRYYEREGLLPEPSRTEANYRMYGDEHIDRLSLIRRCRSLDMALNDIRTLLRFRDAPEENCCEVNVLLDDHINHVAERIASLEALKKQLKCLRRLCNASQAAKDCGILNDLAVETNVDAQSPVGAPTPSRLSARTPSNR